MKAFVEGPSVPLKKILTNLPKEAPVVTRELPGMDNGGSVIPTIGIENEAFEKGLASFSALVETMVVALAEKLAKHGYASKPGYEFGSHDKNVSYNQVTRRIKLSSMTGMGNVARAMRDIAGAGSKAGEAAESFILSHELAHASHRDRAGGLVSEGVNRLAVTPSTGSLPSTRMTEVYQKGRHPKPWMNELEAMVSPGVTAAVRHMPLIGSRTNYEEAALARVGTAYGEAYADTIGIIDTAAKFGLSGKMVALAVERIRRDSTASNIERTGGVPFVNTHGTQDVVSWVANEFSGNPWLPRFLAEHPDEKEQFARIVGTKRLAEALVEYGRVAPANMASTMRTYEKESGKPLSEEGQAVLDALEHMEVSAQEASSVGAMAGMSVASTWERVKGEFHSTALANGLVGDSQGQSIPSLPRLSFPDKEALGKKLGLRRDSNNIVGPGKSPAAG